MPHTQTTATPPRDIWADWLLHDRQAGDAADAAVIASRVRMFADRVLDGITFAPGMTLLDVGAGDGAVGLRAIERWGPDLSVVFADQSERLLRHAARRGEAAGVSRQCAFVRCAADDLAPVSDQSFDALVTRAVLVYVPDKAAAARAMWRVLKPGGLVSIGEPNFQPEAIRAIALRQVLEARRDPAVEPLLPLLCRWQGAQFPDTREKMAASPMTNFAPPDLARWFSGAGFAEVNIAEVTHPAAPARTTWEALVARSPHPLAPPLRQIMNERFTAAERAFFENVFRPRLAQHRARDDQMVYMRARKPGR